MCLSIRRRHTHLSSFQTWTSEAGPAASFPPMFCPTHPQHQSQALSALPTQSIPSVAHLGLPELLPLCPGISRLDPCWSLLTSLCPRWALPTLHTETPSQNAPLPSLGKPQNLARLPAPPHLRRWAAPCPAPAADPQPRCTSPSARPGLVRRRAWHLLIPLPHPCLSPLSLPTSI